MESVKTTEKTNLTEEAQIKIILFKILEIGHNTHKESTLSIVYKKENFKVSMDSNGNASLSGKIGIIAFNASNVLESLGIKIRFFEAQFTHLEDLNFKYTISASIYNFVTVSVSGEFDIKEYFLKCSGLACSATRALRDRHNLLSLEPYEHLVR